MFGTISILVEKQSQVTETDLILLLYKKYFFPQSLMVPEIETILLSCNIWILLYTVLTGILVSAVISMTESPEAMAQMQQMMEHPMGELMQGEPSGHDEHP